MVSGRANFSDPQPHHAFETGTAELPALAGFEEVEERRQRLTREAQWLQDALARLTEAIRMGGPLASLVADVRRQEERRAEVLAELQHLDGIRRAGVTWSDLRGEIRQRLTDWRELIGRQAREARQVLRQLIPGRLMMTPRILGDGTRWYEYSGRPSYGGLLAGLVRVQGLVPPG